MYVPLGRLKLTGGHISVHPFRIQLGYRDNGWSLYQLWRCFDDRWCSQYRHWFDTPLDANLSSLATAYVPAKQVANNYDLCIQQ